MKYKIIFTILLLVVAVGCVQEEQSTSKPLGKAYIGGNRGLDLNFLTGAPPEGVFDTENPFSISIKVENVGEYDIANSVDATIQIAGINPADFGVSKADLTENVPEPLDGASIDSAGNTIQGIITVVDFEDLEYQSTVSGTVPFTLIAEACYEYGTKAQAKLCVLEDLLGKTGEVQFCNPNTQKNVESSGAPIQVISMMENVLGSNKVSFIIKIRNNGMGSLHQQGTECDTSIPAKDKVWVEITDTGLGNLKCTGLKDGTDTEGYATLYNDEASVRCTQSIDAPSDFEKLVEVELRYGYKEAIKKTLNIKQAS